MSDQEAQTFLNFVEQLGQLTEISQAEIADAFRVHGGLSGVVKHGWYVLGYQQLGWLLAGKLSLDQLKSFGETNTELLLQDTEGLYFFVQALVEKEHLSLEERLKLIETMPKPYQPYLFRRFSGKNYVDESSSMTTILHGQAAFDLAAKLTKVGAGDEGWTILFVDDNTGEHWLMEFPESSYHGGGSPTLTLLRNA